MEYFVDILETINQTREAIRKTRTTEDKLIKATGIDDLKDEYLIKTNEKKRDLQIALKILQNNAKIALFNEVMPVVLEVLAKYNGKPYGTKTKQKISDEVKEKTNCRFYISSRYGSDSFDIYPSEGNGYGITCGAVYTDGSQKQILIDNKIQPIKFEEIELYYIDKEYVEDVPQRVEALKVAYKDAVAKQEELKAACDNFNKLAVGINHIYYDKHLYKNMEI